MDDAMVTARMSASKKQRAANILSRNNLNASQAINLMYDRIIEDGQASFLRSDGAPLASPEKWEVASRFVDTLSTPFHSHFDDMTKSEIRQERLHAKGLM